MSSNMDSGSQDMKKGHCLKFEGME